MKKLPIKCTNCGKIFLRSVSRINEGVKRNWHPFCSSKCLGDFRNKQKLLTCENPKCKKQFKRQLNKISAHNYCSRSCAAIVNNQKSPKRHPKIKICPVCGKQFSGQRKYCSPACVPKQLKVTKKQIIEEIRKFYKNYKRIPLKRESHHYRATRLRFGTWNKAIKSAGFEPNPVMFAKKYIANDGHKCDSLAEKIIDDWLYARKIKHQINVFYPGVNGFTVDFLVKNWWIEFFGLSGELKRYDELKEKKMQLVRRCKLNFVEIYPKHLFPKNKLDKLLGFLTRNSA